MTTTDHRTPAVIEGDFVEPPTGNPPPLPTPAKNPHRVALNASLAVLVIALAGLVKTALTDLDAIGWPIGAVFAATVLTCVFSLRNDRWQLAQGDAR